MTDAPREYLAVQEDPSSFCMDWPVIESDETGSGGTVFVLDADGRTVSYVGVDSAASPGRPRGGRDDAADGALDAIGWSRRGPWVPDGFGRHTATVVARAPHSPIPSQSRHSPSLAEEAALHFA